MDASGLPTLPTREEEMRLRHGKKEGKECKKLREDVGKIAGNTSGASVSIPPVGENIFFVTEKKNLSDRTTSRVILSIAAWVLALCGRKTRSNKS